MIDRIDVLNLSRFCYGMSNGIAEQLPEESDGSREDEALRDYFSQLWTMAEALRALALEGTPLDFSPGSFLDNHTGTDYVSINDLIEL